MHIPLPNFSPHIFSHDALRRQGCHLTSRSDEGQLRDDSHCGLLLCHEVLSTDNMVRMTGRPEPSEAAPYYFGYINLVHGDDILHALQNQLDEVLPVLHRISEEKSQHRYAPDKWSIRQMWNHVNDAERVFLFRALWFARGHDTPLPSFEQDVAAVACQASDVAWASHVAEFHQIRLATLSFFRNLPEDAWLRTGTASGNPISVRACAYIVAGHVAHHNAVLHKKYL